MIIFQLFAIIVSIHGLRHNEERMKEERTVTQSKKQFPQSQVNNFLEQVSKETNVVDIFKKYVKNVKVAEDTDGTIYLTTLAGDRLPGGDNNGVILSPGKNFERAPQIYQEGRNAVCKLRKSAVRVEADVHPHEAFFPACIEVNRCTGCCASEDLACYARKSHKVGVVINKYDLINLDDQRKPSFLGQTTVLVEEHDTCECDCAITADRCTSKQKYNRDSCDCTCKNQSERNACDKNPDQSLSWNNYECDCNCRYRRCDHGFYFDLDICACELL